jgi:hypothetical protein
MPKVFTLTRLFLVLLFWGGGMNNAYALVCTSAATGSWNVGATWLAGCGAAGPVAGDAVTISAGHTVTIAAANAAAASLLVSVGGTLNSSRRITLTTTLTVAGILNTTVAAARIRVTGTTNVSGTLNLGPATGNRFTGLVTLNPGAVWTATTGTSNLRGGLTHNGATFTAGTGIYSVTTAAQAFNGISPIVIPRLTVTTVALTNNANLTVGTALAGTGSVVNATATSVLNIGGTSAITTLTATAIGNTVNYTGAAAQTVKATPYFNLGLGGGGVKTLTGLTTVTGNLTTSGIATATTAAALAIGGSLNVGVGTTFTVGAFNITTTGTTNVSGTLAHASAVGVKTYTGALTINAGGVLTNVGNAAITYGGGLVNNGSFTSGTAAQTFTNGGLTHNGLAFTAGTGAFTFSTNPQAINCATALTLPTISTAIALTNNCNLTVTTSLAGLGNFMNNATLNVGFAAAPTVTTLTATVLGNTVNYMLAGNQVVRAIAYHHLGLATSGIKTMTGVTTVAGNLSISGTATMTGNAALTVGGALNYSSSGATTLTAATPISLGSFNQTAGTLAAGANSMTVTGGGAGAWSQTAGAFTSTGTVTFTGASPQINALSAFNNLTFNGSGTALLNSNVTLNGVLTLTNGLIATGANTLEVMTSCVSVTGSAASYVVGNVRLHYPTAAGVTTCTFPVGDGTAYTPAVVAISNVTSTLLNSTLTAFTTTGDHADTTAGISGINKLKSVNRFWTLTPGAGLTFTTYATTFNFVAGDVDAGATPASFIVARKRVGVWSYPTMVAANPLNTTANGMTQAGGFGEFAVGQGFPAFSITKLVSVFWDPVNSSTNPKFIPGALAQYTVLVSNAGGPADNNSVFITDATPPNLALNVSGAGGPVTFTQGTPSSTLTYNFIALADLTDDVDFSNDGGATWTYVPTAAADGCDLTVTHLRINPKGVFIGNPTPPAPSLILVFRMCVQ